LTSERVERRLAAVLAADVAGYSRLMGLDEEGTLRELTLRRTTLDGLIASHRGRIANTAGDSVLAEFGSAVDAVQCSVEAQAALAEANAGVSPDRHISFRIGIHVGDVMIKGGDLFGDGVNIAARLEGIAEPGGICMSDDAYRQIRGKVDTGFDDMGIQTLKNIAEPMRAWRMRSSGPVASTLQTGATESASPLPLPDKPSIAVLPFQNMSGDPEQEYFADGMVEDIITALSRFKSLFVIARNSSFTYKGKVVDIKQVGRELGVRYILEGSVRKAGGRVRITGQLIEADSGAHLWAERFDGAVEDVFELQDRVTSNVVGIIAPRIERAEIKRATTKPTQNLEAYDWYLRGLAQFDRLTREDSKSGIGMFKKAIELDPNFSGAMACIGSCHAIRSLQGWMDDPATDGAEAIGYAQMAQERGRNDAEVLARCALTMTIAAFNADLDIANALADQAVSLNPNQALGWSASGWIKRSLGRHELAIEHFNRALQLNPFDVFNGGVLTGLAWAHFLLGRYAETRQALQRALADSPNYLPALRLSAALDAALGDVSRARETALRILQLNPSEKISNINVVRYSRNLEDRAKSVEFLRLAGLPE